MKLYLSALRLYHIEHSLDDPTKDPLLQYIVKGIRRSQTNNSRPRLPITIQLLRDLKLALHNATALTVHNKRMLWAAFCVAFYGFLRASELCSPAASSFDPMATLCHSDLTLTWSSAQLLIKASKTDPFRQTCTITMGATHTSTCPVAALQNYLPYRKKCSKLPLFLFDDGSYLTRPSLTSHLRSLLLAIGLDPDIYASYSFRIGAATTAAAAGLPDWQIQALGRWSSDCYTQYIHTPQDTLKRLTYNGCTSPYPTPPIGPMRYINIMMYCMARGQRVGMARPAHSLGQ